MASRSQRLYLAQVSGFVLPWKILNVYLSPFKIKVHTEKSYDKIRFAKELEIIVICRSSFVIRSLSLVIIMLMNSHDIQSSLSCLIIITKMSFERFVFLLDIYLTTTKLKHRRRIVHRRKCRRWIINLLNLNSRLSDVKNCQWSKTSFS